MTSSASKKFARALLPGWRASSRPATPQETEYMVRRVFGVAGLALVGIAATFAVMEIVRTRTERGVRHSREVARLARHALTLAIDRETSLRGYLLTRDGSSLEPELAANALLPQKLDSLIALTAGDPVQRRRARNAQEALDRWEREFADAVVRAPVHDVTQAAPERGVLAGKALFDDVRLWFAALIEAEDRVYEKRAERETTLRLFAVRLVALEILAVVAMLLMLRMELLDQTDAVSEQQEQLQEQAVELELQTTQLQEQATALEEHVEEARTMAGQLEVSSERYRSLVDGLPIGVVLVTNEGIQAANPSAERILGVTAEQMAGRSLHDPRWRTIGTNGSPLSSDEHPVLISLQAGEPQSNVVIGVHRPDDAVVWIEISARALFAPGSAKPCAAVATFVDLTQRKQLESQLLQSQKMEAVGQLAGGVAHDFNNVLTVIAGYSAILLEMLDKADPSRADVEEISRAAERAGTLTRQLLAFSRKQVMQPRALELNTEVIYGLEKMLRRLIGEDIGLVTRLEEKLGLVNADPAQLEQVIVNLAVNARDAMPNGGTLTIETANVDLGPDRAGRQIGVSPGRYVMLAMRDTGSGITGETMAHMFEPFFATKENGRGTGLGLATVYGIVKQSGGDIRVVSEPGRGTTIEVYLPRFEYETGVVLPASVRTAEATGTETVLLVEDDNSLRVLSRRVLEARGYTVVEARTGEEGLSLCDAYHGRIDLVATDVVMPGMNGRMLVERLAARRPGLRILFMSGYSDEDMLRRGIVDPGMAFLQKPFTPETLAHKVREVLDGPAAVAIPSLPPPGSRSAVPR